MRKLAIIGAGVSGLSAASKLQKDFSVTLFEKSRGVSGRAATRSRGENCFDHGAQVFEMGSEHCETFIRALEIQGLIGITKPVWTFDIMDTVQAGDPLKNAKKRWTVEGGIKHLGKAIEKGLQVQIIKNCVVNYLQGRDQKWSLHTETGVFPDFDIVLFAIPGPQAASIVERSGMDRSWRDWLAIKLRTAIYRSIISLNLTWEIDHLGERPFSALINTDRLHQITWLGLEHTKPGRIEEGKNSLVCQMSPDWSSIHFRKSIEELSSEVLPLISELLQLELPDPHSIDKQGWLYAIPDTIIDKGELEIMEQEGLFFTGDSFCGGRIHLAIEDGLDTAASLIEKHVD